MNILKPQISLSLLIVLAFSIFYGCKDRVPDPELIIYEVRVKIRNILIANQGTRGDGSLSIYKTFSEKVQLNEYEEVRTEVRHNVYQEANGEKLGSSLTALTRIDNSYYFVLQDADKIIVTDTAFIKIGEITDLKAPTQIYQVANGKAYVTSNTAKYLTVLDFISNTKDRVIGTVGVLTRGIVIDSSFIGLVPSQDVILEINVNRDSVVNRITQTGGLRSVFVDNENLARIYLDDFPTMATWFKNNGENNFVGAVMRGRPRGVTYLSRDDKFYHLDANDNSIYVSEVAFQSAGRKLFAEVEVGEELHALGMDPTNGEAYASYQIENADSTKVLRFSENGQLLNEFTVPSRTSNFFFP